MSTTLFLEVDRAWPGALRRLPVAVPANDGLSELSADDARAHFTELGTGVHVVGESVVCDDYGQPIDPVVVAARDHLSLLLELPPSADVLADVLTFDLSALDGHGRVLFDHRAVCRCGESGAQLRRLSSGVDEPDPDRAP